MNKNTMTVINATCEMLLSLLVHGEEEAFDAFEKSIKTLTIRLKRMQLPIVDMVYAIVGDETAIGTCADLAKLKHKAYIDAGFTDEQAFKLLMNDRERLTQALACRKP